MNMTLDRTNVKTANLKSEAPYDFGFDTVFVISGFLPLPNTSNFPSDGLRNIDKTYGESRTNVADCFATSDRSEELHEEVKPCHKVIHELRRVSGLSWEALAEIFGVSRRSLHFWASGKRLSDENEKHLRHVINVVEFIDRGTARKNRALLLTPDDSGVTGLNLLTKKDYEIFKERFGRGQGRQERPKPNLRTPEALAALPIRLPQDLVSGSNERLHEEKGRSRGLRAARFKKK